VPDSGVPESGVLGSAFGSACGASAAGCGVGSMVSLFTGVSSVLGFSTA
jgi:hypothetical protein